MHSDAASQSGGWRQGCGAAYLLHVGEDVIHLTRFNLVVGVEAWLAWLMLSFVVQQRDVKELV